MVHLQRSLMSPIPLSMSPTCSLAAVMLMVTKSYEVANDSNSISIKTTQTIYHPCQYKLITFVKEQPSCSTFQEGTYSAVNNLISHERVVKKPTPLTNITSAVRVTYEVHNSHGEFEQIQSSLSLASASLFFPTTFVFWVQRGLQH